MSVLGHFLSSERQNWRGKVVFKNDEDVQVRIYMEFDKDDTAASIFTKIVEKLVEIEEKEGDFRVFPTEAELFDVITVQTRKFSSPALLSGKKEDAIDFAKEIFKVLSKPIETISIDESSLEQYHSV